MRRCVVSNWSKAGPPYVTKVIASDTVSQPALGIRQIAPRGIKGSALPGIRGTEQILNRTFTRVAAAVKEGSKLPTDAPQHLMIW